MPMRKFVEKFTKPVDEQDRERLVTWCSARGVTPLDELQSRRPVQIAGEIRSVRIVPRVVLTPRTRPPTTSMPVTSVC